MPAGLHSSKMSRSRSTLVDSSPPDLLGPDGIIKETSSSRPESQPLITEKSLQLRARANWPLYSSTEMSKLKISKSWLKRADYYQDLGRTVGHLDFSNQAQEEMYVYETLGSAEFKRRYQASQPAQDNGYLAGKRMHDLNRTFWREGLAEHTLNPIELIAAANLPSWAYQDLLPTWARKYTFPITMLLEEAELILTRLQLSVPALELTALKYISRWIKSNKTEDKNYADMYLQLIIQTTHQREQQANLVTQLKTNHNHLAEIL